MKRNKQKLYYDANFAVGEYRGMGKYINFFINVLKDNFEIIGLLRTGICKSSHLSFGFSNYILWEQLSLSYFNNKNEGLYIFPYNTAPIFLNKKRFNVLVLHDLIFFENLTGLTLKQKVGKFYRSFIVKNIIHKFDHIITVSEFSKHEIISKFNVLPAKISVIYNTIDNVIVDKQNTCEKKDYFFHIGGEPHYKNTQSLIHAFAILPKYIREKYELRILGIRNSKTLSQYKQLSKALGIEKKIIFLDYQTDKQVETLFQEATLFIFPSLFEGFGIPLIEAMKFGCPLVVSNVSCLPEVAGAAATYFDPYNNFSIADAIRNVIENEEDRNLKVNLGYLQYEKFSINNFSKQVKEWFGINYFKGK